MRNWIRNTIIAAAVVAAGSGLAYRIRNGVPVEPAAVADFNGDGIEE